MTEQLYRILSVRVEIGKSLPPTLMLQLDAEANSAGWSDVTLSKHIYVKQPENGVQGYDIVGEAPTGIVSQVITPVRETHSETLEDWVRGVRIYAASNAVEVTVP